MAVAAAVVLVLTAHNGAAAQGQADEYTPGPDNIWDLQTEDTVNSTHLNNLRSLVFDLEEYDGKIYAAGKFLEARSPDGTVVSRPYVAAFDVQTGALDTTFAPVLDAPALSISVVGDGTILVGGEFTDGIVRLDATTGARIAAFDVNIANSWGNPAVWDMELLGNDLYAVGTFDIADGMTVGNMAKIDLAASTVSTTWTPTSQGIDDGTNGSGSVLVWAIASDPARGRLYLAGKFDAINNDASLDNFAIVNMTDGQPIAGIPQSDPLYAQNHDDCSPGVASCWHIDNWYYTVEVDLVNDNVWLGGQAHTTIMLNASDLSVVKHSFTNKALNDVSQGGDTQAIHVGTNTVWSGCHCWGSVKVEDPLPVISYGDTYRTMVDEFRTEDHQDVRGNYGMDRITGELTPQIFDLTGQAGGYALLEDSNGRLWSGGQYLSGASRTLTGLARFSPVGGIVVAPPTSCTLVETPTGIDVSWVRGDSGEALDFVIRRSRDGSGYSWASRIDAPTTSWSDNSVVVLSSYSYRVVARQGADVSPPTYCTPNPLIFQDIIPAIGPTSCTVVSAAGAMNVTWVDGPNSNAATHRVDRSVAAGAFSQRATTGNVTQYLDTNMVLGRAYSYRIVAVTAAGEQSAPLDCSPAPLIYTNDFDCQGLTPTIIGTYGDDIIQGTPGDDVIKALSGNDVVNASGGNDIICADNGDDLVYGSGGNDIVRGGAGDDTVYGGNGNDIIYGYAHDDELYGGAGIDRLYGFAGNDRLDGGAGNDSMWGGPDNDHLLGGTEDDQLYGGAGTDRLWGGRGNDGLYSGPGAADTNNGGANSDTCAGARSANTTACEA